MASPRLRKCKNIGSAKTCKIVVRRCVGTPARTVTMRRGDSDDDEGSAPTVAPGTMDDLDDLAAALSGIELASKAPENREGSAGDPDTILARALAGIAEDAASTPPPSTKGDMPRRSPRLKPFPKTPAGTGGMGDGEEWRKPKLVVRYKRENATPATSAANTPEKETPKESFETARESFSEVKEEEEGGQEASSPAPVSVATLASRYVVVKPEVDIVKPEKDIEDEKDQPSSAPSPAIKSHQVHRKPRSKVKTKPRDPSSFAAFREMRREETKAETEADQLASMLEKKVSIAELDTPSRRGGRKAPARAVRSGEDVGVVGLCYSDVMELHEGPAQHFERPARHAATVARMKKDGLEDKCALIAAREATDEELLTCHSREHLAYVANAFDHTSDEAVQGVGDIYWTEHTERCARTAAGSACEAAAAVASGTCHRAFAVVRPPGHHAECARAMGFCFYNNTAVAARAALAAHSHVNRVLLLDWDVHHGNG